MGVQKAQHVPLLFIGPLWLGSDFPAVLGTLPRTHRRGFLAQVVWIAASSAHTGGDGRVTSPVAFEVPKRHTQLEGEGKPVRTRPYSVELHATVAIADPARRLGSIQPAETISVRDNFQITARIDDLFGCDGPGQGLVPLLVIPLLLACPLLCFRHC